MANFVVANTAFSWAGIQVRVGDVYEDDHVLYVQFPARFDRQQAFVTGSPGTVLAAGTLGATIVGSVPVTNDGGTVLGYVPLYDAITEP